MEVLQGKLKINRRRENLSTLPRKVQNKAKQFVLAEEKKYVPMFIKSERIVPKISQVGEIIKDYHLKNNHIRTEKLYHTVYNIFELAGVMCDKNVVCDEL